jgi:hypothetical protein
VGWLARAGAERGVGIADGEHQGGQQLDKVLEKLTTISTACDTLVKGHADLAKRIDDLEKRGQRGDGARRGGASRADSSGWISSGRKRELDLLTFSTPINKLPTSGGRMRRASCPASSPSIIVAGSSAAGNGSRRGLPTVISARLTIRC